MAYLEYHPKQPLYHFCSTDAFRQILLSKVLWCTDLDSSNDPRELKFGLENFIDAMKFVRDNECKGLAGEFIENLANELTRMHGAQQAFCTCFSLEKDSLPMWREYGDSCRGVAIGFRPTSITSMPGRIQKVRYLDSETREDFRQLVRDLVYKFDPNHSPTDAIYWALAVSELLAATTSLKHHTWNYENEIRYVFAQARIEPDRSIPISRFPDGRLIFWERPLIRRCGAERANYMEFEFGRLQQQTYQSSRAIAEIVVGPQCNLTTDEIKSRLQDNGFENFEVVNSECLVRPQH